MGEFEGCGMVGAPGVGDSPGYGFSYLRVIGSKTTWRGKTSPTGDQDPEGLACNNILCYVPQVPVCSWAAGPQSPYL